MQNKRNYIAAIDLGSNSFRLLIKNINKHGDILSGETIINELHTVRLGENLSKSGILSSKAIERGLEVCRLFAAKLDEYKPVTRICGTEALRTAANSSQFTKPAQDIFSTHVEILSRQEEAELTLLGCTADIDLRCSPHLVVDVGGGSTELALIDYPTAPKLCSLPIGAINLTETFITQLPESATEIEHLARHIHEIVHPALTPILPDHSDLILLASGGTATSLAALDLELQIYQPGIIHGHPISAAKIDNFIKEISQLSLTQRNKLPCLAKRGEIILAGMLIYQQIIKITGLKQFRVSSRGLLAGILYKMLGFVPLPNLRPSPR